jgi:hypothetical protein
MTWAEALAYLALWSAVGCALFSLFVVAVFRSGFVWTARDQDGLLKKKMPLSGYLAMLTIPLGLTGLQLAANYFGLPRHGVEVGFWSLWLLNFVHYLILFAYDTLVIDGLVLGVWRPGFLQLPDEMGRESMKRHMLLSLPVGVVAGLVLTAINTSLSHFLLLAS